MPKPTPVAFPNPEYDDETVGDVLMEAGNGIIHEIPCLPAISEVDDSWDA